MLKDKIYLASQSPRRRELISYLFENVDILDVSFREPESRGRNPLDYLRQCVNEKWSQAAPLWEGKRPPSGAGLLVADTMVFHKQELLGKPKDAREARQMLKRLSGSRHTVFTGFCLGRNNGTHTQLSDPIIVETEITFRHLSPIDIDQYVRSREPLDKAGAYGFQELGLRFIQSVEGPYSNVVGLPLEAIRIQAHAMGFRA